MALRRVGVVGAGVMGTGIAFVCAQAGLEVTLVDVEWERVERAMTAIDSLLSKKVAEGKISEGDKVRALRRLKGATQLEALRGVDFVIEAVTEDMEVKKRVFEELDQLLPPHTIVATNTSSLSISELAAVTQRPEKVVGMHFFNPVPLMELVQVVKPETTSEETVRIAWELAERLGKLPVLIKRDTPGFVSYL
ncbi:MAG: hypothetical protein DRG55_04055 [Deltaproteobacteria bacterium]|nr:MAG: hypothetical protein DRG55_04055 [Deltaproteobacteria bacterium]